MPQGRHQAQGMSQRRAVFQVQGQVADAVFPVGVEARLQARAGIEVAHAEVVGLTVLIVADVLFG